jgi:hypothetical protein
LIAGSPGNTAQELDETLRLPTGSDRSISVSIKLNSVVRQ